MRLAEVVRGWRGKRSQRDLAALTGLSQRTIVFLEKGGSVKLGTLRQIANCLGLNREQWMEGAAAWVRQELGDDDFKRLQVGGAGLDRAEEGKLIEMWRFLPSRHQQQLMLAMRRPRVLDCLGAINAVEDDR